MRRGTRYEVSTVGFDPSRQNVGADPDLSGYNVGVRVPGVPLSDNRRYTFLLAGARFGGNRKFRLVGMRQLVTIGQFVENLAMGCEYPLELGVTSPQWSFVDGNISWHIMRVPIPEMNTAHPENAEGLQFLYSRTPALLFNTTPADVGGYTAPYGGKIPGMPLTAELGTIRDLRTLWTSDFAWGSLDVEVEGPCDIMLFASVKQTNPSTRCTLVLPGVLPAGTQSLPPEDAFLVNFPGAMYWRIAGSLIFEDPAMIEGSMPVEEPVRTFVTPPMDPARAALIAKKSSPPT
jgi:hypothetical protein